MIVRVVSAALVLIAMAPRSKSSSTRGRSSRRASSPISPSRAISSASPRWPVVANGDRPRSHALESFRTAAAAYLTVTFVVFLLLLSGELEVGLGLGWVDFVLHKLFPIIVVADWLIDPPQVRLTRRDALAWLAYPVVWTVLTIVRGALDDWYPYPFLDPADGGYAAVAVTVLAITVGFLGFAALLVWLSNARLARPERRLA